MALQLQLTKVLHFYFIIVWITGGSILDNVALLCSLRSHVCATVATVVEQVMATKEDSNKKSKGHGGKNPSLTEVWQIKRGRGSERTREREACANTFLLQRVRRGICGEGERRRVIEVFSTSRRDSTSSRKPLRSAVKDVFLQAHVCRNGSVT